MNRMRADKRSRLIQTAVKLAHRQGFRKTTLADIAKEAKVPLGNVYYYFKTKEEIGEAIIAQRLQGFKAILEKFDELSSPRQRLEAFVQMMAENREALARGGCPLGTLCSELQKEGGALANKATALFAELLAWLEAQFRELGRAADSRGLALHLLSVQQGISVLANSFQDPNLVSLEARRLKEWLRTV